MLSSQSIKKKSSKDNSLSRLLTKVVPHGWKTFSFLRIPKEKDLLDFRNRIWDSQVPFIPCQKL